MPSYRFKFLAYRSGYFSPRQIIHMVCCANFCKAMKILCIFKFQQTSSTIIVINRGEVIQSILNTVQVRILSEMNDTLMMDFCNYGTLQEAYMSVLCVLFCCQTDVVWFYKLSCFYLVCVLVFYSVFCVIRYLILPQLFTYRE